MPLTDQEQVVWATHVQEGLRVTLVVAGQKTPVVLWSLDEARPPRPYQLPRVAAP